MEGSSTAPLRPEDWLIGALGVWMGSPEDGWRRLGPFTYVVNDLLVEAHAEPATEARLLVAGGHGLWQASGDPTQRWQQLHDETLTEVMAVRTTPEGIVVAGSYGVATATPDDLGLPRWRSHTETHVPDERYTNTLNLGDGAVQLAGTEAGVLVSDDGGSTWRMSDLVDTAVRALHRMDDHWLAGSDTRGLWRSDDGLHWTSVETPTTAVFSIAAAGQQLLLGGYDGIHVRAADGSWRRVGPRILVRALATGGNDAGSLWLAGGDPGGLWVSKDEGVSWGRSGQFESVRAICSPEGN